MKKLSFFLITAFFAGMTAAQVNDSAAVKTEIIMRAEDSAAAETEANAQAEDSAAAETEITAKDALKAAAYTLTVNVNPANGGAVSRNPDKETYAPGDTVIVTAAPENGYTFTGWTGASANRKNPLTVTMNSDKTLTAVFYKKLYIEPKPVPMERTRAKQERESDGGSGVSADNDGGRTYNASAVFSSLSDVYVLPGVYISYNIREGYRKFDDVDGYMHVENTNPFIIGFSVGKRVSIDNQRLRLQALFELGRGSVKDNGEYEVSTNLGPTWVSLHSVYWTGGLLADAHLLLPVNERTHFVSAGLGAHLTYFDTMLKTLAGGEEVKGGSDGMRGALSPSVNLGYGIEYKLESGGAACISYNMRFWRSASYKEAGGLFPMGVNYTEFFFSQSIQLQYLWSPRKKQS